MKTPSNLPPGVSNADIERQVGGDPVDDSGPAFPTSSGRNNVYGSNGMTLRDYFAAMAMREKIKDVPRSAITSPRKVEFEWVAFMAYGVADAMLRARRR